MNCASNFSCSYTNSLIALFPEIIMFQEYNTDVKSGFGIVLDSGYHLPLFSLDRISEQVLNISVNDSSISSDISV